MKRVLAYFASLLLIPRIVWISGTRIHFGYWISPPSVDRVIGLITSLDRFMSVCDEELDAEFDHAALGNPSVERRTRFRLDAT